MVREELLLSAVEQLESWRADKLGMDTGITWVNWRNGSFQVKMLWRRNPTFVCFLDFGKNFSARDSVLKAVFTRFAVDGQKPYLERGHGWSKMDYSLDASMFISVNQVAEIATELGVDFSVLYVQESISSRHIFDTLGIPLVPGEMGKEWIGGEFIPYSCPIGQNL
ncbi:hypothetical protein YA0089_26275 [Pseudomonas viridiflava]|uniref:hypothetical protein n=1 Tax=Pseudomonas viridiflava TaxID=33069 RepID=UPI0018E5BE2E|nr:hypothetical protein [Pseudomonas viridiflava]MBI6727123.1 hypothetical protein [Pseudomonas viridiflava]